MNLSDIQARLAAFAEAREWDQFHSPKNLSMALAVETGELLEIFQWMTEAQSCEISATPSKLAAVQEELADVAIYLIRLADKLEVDLEAAVLTKIEANARKYPEHLARGNAKKYTEFPDD